MHSTQKEQQPPVHVALCPYGLQVIKVFPSIVFEEGGKIQYRMLQKLFMHQMQRDEEASGAAVAIEKRVNRLELIMAHGYANECGNLRRGLMPKTLKIAEEVGEIDEWRRNELCGGGSRSPDPVLAHANFSRHLVFATDSLQQHGVRAFQHTHAQRKRRQFLHAP